MRRNRLRERDAFGRSVGRSVVNPTIKIQSFANTFIHSFTTIVHAPRVARGTRALGHGARARRGDVPRAVFAHDEIDARLGQMRRVHDV